MFLPECIFQYNLICDKTAVNAFCNAAFFLGWGIFGIPLGLLADRFGRTHMMFICLFVFALFSELSAFITATWQFIVIRAILGAAYSGCGVNLYILMNEFVPVRKRALCSNLIHFSHSVSVFLIIGVSYYEQRWRWQEIFCGLPAVLSLAFWL